MWKGTLDLSWRLSKLLCALDFIHSHWIDVTYEKIDLDMKKKKVLLQLCMRGSYNIYIYRLHGNYSIHNYCNIMLLKFSHRYHQWTQMCSALWSTASLENKGVGTESLVKSSGGTFKCIGIVQQQNRPDIECCLGVGLWIIT